MLARSTTRARMRAATCAGMLALACLTAMPQARAGTIIYTPDNCGISDQDYYNGIRCSYNGLVLYYHPNLDGATAELIGNIPSYSSTCSAECIYVYDYIFMGAFDGPTDGEGQGVRNNAASAGNWTTCWYTLYVYPNYLGPSQTISPGTWTNLDSTLRNNEASQWTGCPA